MCMHLTSIQGTHILMLAKRPKVIMKINVPSSITGKEKGSELLEEG